jgi:FAD:protein FMN transferase
MKRPIRCTVNGVLGTSLDLQVVVNVHRLSNLNKIRARIEQVVLNEIDRLARVFSIYDPMSELRRWRVGAVAGSSATVSQELAGLLALSAEWQLKSSGAYNPAVGAVFDRWERAAATGDVPSIDETDEWAGSLQGVPYVVHGTQVECIADCTGLSFNSLAKGLIADRAIAALLESDLGVGGACVNLGGDLAVHNHSMRIGVEHPTRPYDNEPALCTLTITNGGVATSGSSRRPIVIDERSFSHLIDPRTCRPIDNSGSVTVVAESAATADVLATIVSVTGELIPGFAMGIATPTGELHMTQSFELLVR